MRDTRSLIRSPQADAAETSTSVAAARAFVLRYGWNAMAYQILNPGIRLWFGADGESVVGYVVAGGYCVVAGAPVGPPDQLGSIAQAFSESARRAGRRVCFFGAQERLAAALRAEGALAELLLGAQPVWRPHQLVATIEAKASLRAQLTRARNKGVTISQWEGGRAQNHPDLLRCLRSWLATRGLPPMHFLIEPDTLARVLDRRVLVAEQAGRVMGYLVASPVPLRHGWLIEQMIRGPGAPNGTVELLLATAARAMTDEGAAYLTLGLSPLSRRVGIPQHPQPPLIHLLLWWVRAHTRRFYNFEGLDAFKAKFRPEGWEPVYAIAQAPRIPLRLLYAIAGAFGGEPPPIFIGRALARAAWQELHWAQRTLHSRG
jgi:phosphatidylglycerol lysyltransferase